MSLELDIRYAFTQKWDVVKINADNGENMSLNLHVPYILKCEHINYEPYREVSAYQGK
jgi:hypothetical protein